MTELTIGRVGHPTAGGIELQGPVSVVPTSAGQLAMSGTHLGLTSLADAQALRHQLEGLVDSDEPVVPVTWTEDATIDGFYRVLDVTTELGEAALCEFVLDWDVQLERLAGHQAAAMDSAVSVLLIPTSPVIGGTNPQDNAFYAVQGGALDWSPGFGGGTIATVPTATGNVLKRRGGHSVPATYYPSWLVRPADYYQGAATIEAEANLRPIVGDVTGWSTLATTSRPTWRMSNGLVRVSTDPVTNPERISVSHWDGTQWDAARQYRITASGSDIVLSAPRVVINTPERCVLRFANAFSATVDARIQIDVEIRRGDRMVMIRLTSDLPKQYALVDHAGAAYTALTNGIREIAANAGGNRSILSMAQASTATLGTGILTSTSTLLFRCQLAIGAEVPSGAASPNDAQSQIYGAWATAQATDRIVAR